VLALNAKIPPPALRNAMQKIFVFRNANPEDQKKTNVFDPAQDQVHREFQVLKIIDALKIFNAFCSRKRDLNNMPAIVLSEYCGKPMIKPTSAELIGSRMLKAFSAFMEGIGAKRRNIKLSVGNTWVNVMVCEAAFQVQNEEQWEIARTTTTGVRRPVPGRSGTASFLTGMTRRNAGR
jgi:hypothetical protein